MSNNNTQDLHSRINKIYQELGEIIKQSENEWPNPERVNGRWYKINFGHALVNYQNGKQCFGLNNVGQWTECYDSGRFWDKWRDSTESEINDMLVKEAVNKNIEQGVTIKSPSAIYSIKLPTFREFEYDKDQDRLYYVYESGVKIPVYDSGKWAELIPAKPPIMIGSYVVIIDGWSALINDYSYTKSSLLLLYDTASLHKVNVSIMGVQVAKETIEKIIQRLDK